jgi:hypothetical protein
VSQPGGTIASEEAGRFEAAQRHKRKIACADGGTRIFGSPMAAAHHTERLLEAVLLFVEWLEVACGVVLAEPLPELGLLAASCLFLAALRGGDRGQKTVRQAETELVVTWGRLTVRLRRRTSA